MHYVVKHKQKPVVDLGNDIHSMSITLLSSSHPIYEDKPWATTYKYGERIYKGVMRFHGINAISKDLYYLKPWEGYHVIGNIKDHDFEMTEFRPNSLFNRQTPPYTEVHFTAKTLSWYKK